MKIARLIQLLTPLLLILIFLLGSYLRYINLSHLGFEFDTTIMYTWAHEANNRGFFDFWQNYGDLLDYLPGGIFLFMLIERISSLFNASLETFVLTLKLANWGFDLVIASVLYFSARTFGRLNKSSSLVISGVSYVLPSLWFISALWGQIESIVLGVEILSIALLYRALTYKTNHQKEALTFSALAGVFFAISFWVKMQVILLFPAIALLLFTHRNKHVFYSFFFSALITTGAIITVPLASSPIRTLTVLAEPILRHDIMSVSAASFWPLIDLNLASTTGLFVVNGKNILSLRALALALFGGINLLALWMYITQVSKPGPVLQRIKETFSIPITLFSSLFTTTIFAYSYYLFIPKMHERYLYPATIGMLLVATVIKDTRQRTIILLLTILVSFSHLLNLMSSFTWAGYTNPSWVSHGIKVMSFNPDRLSSLANILVFIALLVFYTTVGRNRVIINREATLG